MMTTMTNIIDQINDLIRQKMPTSSDRDAGYISGLRDVKAILVEAQKDGPRYFGNKNNCDTPLN